MTMENVGFPVLLIVAASILPGSFGLRMKNFKPMVYLVRKRITIRCQPL